MNTGLTALHNHLKHSQAVNKSPNPQPRRSYKVPQTPSCCLLQLQELPWPTELTSPEQVIGLKSEPAASPSVCRSVAARDGTLYYFLLDKAQSG